MPISLRLLFLIFAFIAFFIPVFSAAQQAPEAVSSITYAHEWVVAQYLLPDSLIIAEEVSRKPFESEEQKNKMVDFLRAYRAGMHELIDQENQQISTYYYTDSIIVLERKNKEYADEFILINPQSWAQNIYHSYETGGYTVTTSKIFYPYTPWQVTFKTDTLPEDKKEVLGYNCFKVNVLEERRKLSEPVSLSSPIIRQKYEMYVTDKLNFYAHFICGAWGPQIKMCALEIKIYNPDAPKDYKIFRAVDVQSNLNSQLVELPARFRGQ